MWLCCRARGVEQVASSLLWNSHIFFYELTEGGGNREISSHVQAAMRLMLCRISPINQTLFGPFQQAKVEIPKDNTSSQRKVLHHWGRKQNYAFALACKGLTGSRLGLMQIVRKIRLPVSVVVNGSHHSPPLTVDRRGRNGAWPRSHKYPFQIDSDEGSAALHGQHTSSKRASQPSSWPGLNMSQNPMLWLDVRL